MRESGQARHAPKHTPSFGTQVAWMLLSSALALLFSEWIVRRADGGALPQLDCYQSTAGGALRLSPRCERTLFRPGGGTWTLRVDANGLRQEGPAPTTPWLVVGDSQVLGMNVDFADTWVARLQAQGWAIVSAGVPGHGVDDALAHADALLDVLHPRGVVAVINAANDWAEADTPLPRRCTVVDGWLLRPSDTNRLVGRFFATPLAASHLLSYAVTLLGRDHGDDPARRRFADSPWGQHARDPASTSREAAAIAGAVARFSVAHPGLPLYLLLLPVDFETSEARARAVLPAALLDATAPWREPGYWDELRAELPVVPVVDLHAALADPTDFLDADYHLSPAGHAVFAERLGAALPP